MVRNTQYATEEDIFDADLKVPSKLNFGGNLHFTVNKSGNRYFHFRYSLHGKSLMLQIGKYPDMSLAEAKKRAAVLQAKVVNDRQESREASIHDKLLKSKKMREIKRVQKEKTSSVENLDGSSFKYLEDGSRFIQNLFSTNISESVRWVIWFQILMPWRAKEFFYSKFKDIDRSGKIWTIYKKNRDGKKYVFSYLEHLSPSVDESLHDYFNNCYSGLPKRVSPLAYESLNSNFGFFDGEDDLFPNWINLSIAMRNKELREAMDRVWPDYLLDANAFKKFFIAWAGKYSFFSSELISALVLDNDPDGSNYDNENYIRQKKSLVDWWGLELMKMKKSRLGRNFPQRKFY